MIQLPNPFLKSVAENAPDTAAAPVSPAPCGAAAVPDPLDEYRFVLDEAALAEALKEPLPVFIRAPSDAYLDALMDLAAA